MELLLSRRLTLEEKLNRASVFVSNYVPTRDCSQVPFRIAELENLAAEFDNVQQHIENLATSELRGEEGQVRAVIEEKLYVTRASLSALLPHASSATSSASSVAVSGIKLPTIALPEFSGNDMHWAAFRDTFEALIHKNSEVMEIQKFHYLRAALKCEAAKLIESFPLCAIKNQIAWKSLVDRYANDYLQKKRHLQSMFCMTRVTRESNVALHKLVDDFDRHVKMLQQLGEKTGHWSTMLEYVLCTKLPEETLKTWEDHASTLETPDYNTLIEFLQLQRKLRILESISMNCQTPYKKLTRIVKGPNIRKSESAV